MYEINWTYTNYQYHSISMNIITKFIKWTIYNESTESYKSLTGGFRSQYWSINGWYNILWLVDQGSSHLNGGFHKWGYPKWMVYNGKTIYKWMIWGYPYFRKPPNHLSSIRKVTGLRQLHERSQTRHLAECCSPGSGRGVHEILLPGCLKIFCRFL